MRPNLLIIMLVIVMAACFANTPVVLGQERKISEASKEEEGQVLRALLDEVRQLRLALQRANSINYRLQATLERIRLQQGRVDSLTRGLENVRARISDLKNARPQMDEQIKSAEDLMERAPDSTRRAEIEREVKEMKGRLGSWTREEEQWRERETTLNAELQVEQSKHNDLHGQLETTVRELERQ